MGQLHGTLSAGDNELFSASSEANSVVVVVDGAVTVAFGELATVNSFPLAADAPYSFNGRNFSSANLHIYSVAGGETYKILW